MKKTRNAIAAAGIALVLGAGATGAAVALGGDGDGDEGATGPAADRAARAAVRAFPGARVTAVEREAEGAARWEAELTRRDGTTVDVALDRDYRVVAVDEESDERDDDERDDRDAQAVGDDARRAGAAALARFPGGRVTAIERDADGTATWEVEVTRTDGAHVDVDLDARLHIVAVDDPE